MQPATQHSADTRRAVSEPQQFPPLEQVNRPTVPTEHARPTTRPITEPTSEKVCPVQCLAQMIQRPAVPVR